MLPFLTHMARLYEQFVVAWMRAHLPRHMVLTAQERYDIDRASGLAFAIDVVLRDTATGTTRGVLDTTYKRVSTPSTDDIAQVVAYSKAMHCHDAILAYPFAPTRPLDVTIGDVRGRSITFTLDQDLETAGTAFLSDLLSIHSTPHVSPDPSLASPWQHDQWCPRCGVLRHRHGRVIPWRSAI
jgi:5-methylcytosine-specific restriction enzyme subunit McrC